jgi:hypothetical protein
MDNAHVGNVVGTGGTIGGRFRDDVQSMEDPALSGVLERWPLIIVGLGFSEQVPRLCI